jgi:hypothetical protein
MQTRLGYHGMSNLIIVLPTFGQESSTATLPLVSSPPVIRFVLNDGKQSNHSWNRQRRLETVVCRPRGDMMEVTSIF